MLRAIVALGLLGFALSGCNGPCRQLADKICDCLDSPREQTSCRRRLDQNESQLPDPLPDEDAVCESLLETCTCSAYALGLTERCGLSRGFHFSEATAAD